MGFVFGIDHWIVANLGISSEIYDKQARKITPHTIYYLIRLADLELYL